MSYLRIKICGITSLDDALCAAEAGADAVGLIFVEGTPRYVTPAAAAAIVAGLPPFVCPVGVFWDHAPAHVAAVVAECGLGAVQLHGVEPPEVVAAMPRPVLKTIKIREAADLAQLDRYKPAAFLLDSPARWSEGEARGPDLLDARPRGGGAGAGDPGGGAHPRDGGRGRPRGAAVGRRRQLRRRGRAGPEGSGQGRAVHPGGAGGRGPARRRG